MLCIAALTLILSAFADDIPRGLHPDLKYLLDLAKENAPSEVRLHGFTAEGDTVYAIRIEDSETLVTQEEGMIEPKRSNGFASIILVPEYDPATERFESHIFREALFSMQYRLLDVAPSIIEDKLNWADLYTLDFKQGFSAEVLNQLGRLPGLKYIEPNKTFEMLKSEAVKCPEDVLWGRNLISAPDVDGTNGDIVIAIFDNDLGSSHDVLGHVGIVSAIDNGAPTSRDSYFHGTHLTGIVTSAITSRPKFMGVYPNCETVMVRTVKSVGAVSFLPSDFSRAATIAIDLDADIILMAYEVKSFWPNEILTCTTSLKEACRAGILFVTAAGNDSQVNLDGQNIFPQNVNHDNIIVVTSVGLDKKYYPGATYGPGTVDIAAPGEAIYSTSSPGEKFECHTGTSQAAAYVAGALGIIWQHHGASTPAREIQNLLYAKYCKEEVPSLMGKCKKGRLLNLSILSPMTSAPPVDLSRNPAPTPDGEEETNPVPDPAKRKPCRQGPPSRISR